MKPLISIITPSFNQADYLEQTILSVLNEKTDEVELIVIDGGSTDGSVQILEKYSSVIDYWISKPDGGQVDALEKGLQVAKGTWYGWQNSDDYYLPGALTAAVAAIKELNSCLEVGYIFGDMVMVDQRGNTIREHKYVEPTVEGMLSEGMLIVNQSLFWRADNKGLKFNSEYNFSFDYDFFLQLVSTSRGVFVRNLVGAFRVHGLAKSTKDLNRFNEENKAIISGYQNISKRRGWVLKIRRGISLLCRGEFKYVLDGVVRRFGFVSPSN